MSLRTGPAAAPLRGTCAVPGDKAISHRAAILGALAEGTTTIAGFSPAGDCEATLSLIARLGAEVRRSGDAVAVGGLGAPGIREVPREPLDCRRSGTTMRLLAGVLASMPVEAELGGDRQLLGRPMGRVADPLRRMGAEVRTAEGGRPPLRVRGGGLRGIGYTLPVASAQVKSAVLLAGLRADGQTEVREPVPTRDHTERMLAEMGADLRVLDDGAGRRIRLAPGALHALDLRIPGDPSSAAPLVAAAALVAGSDLRIEGLCANPGRIGLLRVLQRMGARLEVEPAATGAEPVANLRVRHSSLSATSVAEAEVPSLVDELPLLAVLAARAEGETVVRGAGELRVKESDRIAGIASGLRTLGADIEELPDGFAVRGPTDLRGGRVDARSDHRLAMAFTVAGLVADGPVLIDGMEFVGDSFPGFERQLEALR